MKPLTPLKFIPRQHGYTFPAQWNPHRGTIAAWPFERGETWMVPLEEVRAEYREFVRAIAADEPVFLLIADDECRASFEQELPNSPNIIPIDLPLDDCWLRDSGPIFVTRDSRIVPITWRFNAWGGKFKAENDSKVGAAVLPRIGARAALAAPLTLEGGSIECNGAGIALTTRSCIMSEERNPGLAESQVTEIIADYFGLDRVIVLDSGFTSGDHTDGHIDMAARFTPSGAVLVNTATDDGHPSAGAFRANAIAIQQAGLPIQRLLLPKHSFTGSNWGGGTVLVPANYANFYATGRSVFVPQFGDPHDEPALTTIASCFPSHRIVGLPARAIVTGGGGIFNCLTQQVPTGEFIEKD